MQLAIECQTRPEKTNPRALRRAGRIPAVMYGHNGTESISLTVDAKDVKKLLKEPAVNNSLIDLTISDSGWKGKTLLREVQSHPWKGFTYHLSFFATASQDTVEVELPLHFTGEPYGVKTDGGILETLMVTVAVKCAPDNMPESIEIDIAHMHVGDSLQVGELILPEGVEAVADAKQTIVSIQGLRGTKGTGEEEEEEEVEAPEVS
ncbi:50S ribosomal protein L25/general stress protein Ctc [Oscillatoriales cyanobacterium LEGE 11467]|uniref:Large ribosomal subunit protein bL25 n=1 Tax=Zarconia navalis LEGE 11467 TaxID=1828826 RepID=A0A928VUB5_9CYAN|nr:50S ribosomal protein L25/general stress protein Ctc [Zarconia navalis]MBE9040296.1 50S ribosomal protein L25/general stress protein Ctc [Zarconia navalis LEGE 11467]